MTTHCPDCHSLIPVRKPGKDGRCGYCRSQVGQRSRRDVWAWRGYDHNELLTRLGRAR